jgi:two-component system, chemotaxis family, CheB/CheR fusion protein
VYEELQSAVEELETTNEQLHSTNEELETMNEELHSTNEELETISRELRDRSSEVDQLNKFLESILGSLQSAVIVLDREMQVLAWNRQAEDLWGLRSTEVIGRHFLSLDIGLPVDALTGSVRACLNGNGGQQQLERRAINRRGRRVNVSVTVSGLTCDRTGGGVLIMMDATPVIDGSEPRTGGEVSAVSQVDDPDGSGGDGPGGDGSGGD